MDMQELVLKTTIWIDRLQLKEAKCEMIFLEKFTGTKADRPELEKLFDHVRKGDTVIIRELTRLSRSRDDLFKLVKRIEGKGANIKSLKETWLDTTTSSGKLMFPIFAGINEFERDIISERTKQGLESARARGRQGGQT